MHTNNNGFTLMELIVVITIILVLGTIAAANITAALPTYKLRSAAGEVYSTISRARSLAIKFKRSVSVRFDVANGGYVLDPTGGMRASYLNQHFPPEKSGSKFKTLTEFFGGGVKFGFPGRADDVTFTNDTLTFDSMGVTKASDAYVYLQNSKGEGFRVGVKGLAGNLVIDKCKKAGVVQDSGVDCTL